MNSIDIVIWQFVVFRLVIFAQLLAYGEKISISNILSYYPIYSSDNGWWLIYLIVGIVGSLEIGKILRIGIWGKILKRMHVV